MAQILVRELETDVVEKLKMRAKRHGRSLQSEARQILTQSAGMHPGHAKEVARQWHKKLAGRKFPDTTKLLHEDRSR